MDRCPLDSSPLDSLLPDFDVEPEEFSLFATADDSFLPVSVLSDDPPPQPLATTRLRAERTTPQAVDRLKVVRKGIGEFR